MNRFLRILIAAAMVLGLVGPLSTVTTFAQTTAGSQAASTAGAVQGTVHDSNGNPIADVTITMRGAATLTTRSDAKGTFGFSNVTPGIFSVTASKAGYDTATDPSFAVLAGEVDKLDVVMNAITFSSLRTIASVRAVGRGTFNTTTASAQIVTSADYANQSATQVQRVLDQTPGIVIDHPGTSANNASPGAITFPSIRGGLGFETASFIDGHPLSVGKYGDYVTTFLNPYVLQSSEIIKGPGAMPPELAYAIGGTVNFRTKDPTRVPTGNLVLGYSTTQGSFMNAGYSGTTSNGKFGWVLDYGVNSFYGPLNSDAQYWNLPSSATINGKPVGFTTNNPVNPGVANNPFAYSSTMEACCFPVSNVYVNKTELVKMRYNFSPVTSFTGSYLGSQTWTDQNGNHVMGINQLFAPCGLNPASPNGASAAACPQYPAAQVAAGQQVFTWQNIFTPPGEWEVNNEPIFEGDLRSVIGQDTVLARAYSASINRLQYNAIDDPNGTYTGTFNAYGCAGSCSKAGATVYTGQPVTITVPNAYFRDSEEDKLNGYTLEYNHPFGGNNLLTASFDTVYSATKAFGWSGPNESFSVPDGAHQRYNTLLLKGSIFLTPKLQMLLGNYFESYLQHYSPDQGKTFKDTNISRYDPRIAFEWRPTSRVAYRLSAGTAIAPPYAALLNTATAFNNYRSGSPFATGTLNNPNLQPETATAYDLGADFRLGADQSTFLTVDTYMTNLRNQFLNGTISTPDCPFYDPTAKGCTTVAPASTNKNVPIFFTQPQNIGTARYEGVELALRRIVPAGFGYKLQGSLLRAYPYGLGPCFYGIVQVVNGTPQVNCNVAGSNLGLVNNINFQGSGTSGSNPQAGISGSGFFGISNHAIPYAQAYVEINHRWLNGMYASFGEQLYGHNNSLNVPAFWVANGTFRLPTSKNSDQSYVQFSVDNVFNAYGNSWITQAAGVPAVLVNGQVGVTNANVIGPRNFRMVFTQNVGGNP